MASKEDEEELLRRRQEADRSIISPEDAATAAAMTRADQISTQAATTRMNYEAGLAAKAAARQPLQSATLPGQGALDIAPPGTPLMNLRGTVNPSTGQTQYRNVAGPRDFNDLVGSAVDARRGAMEARKGQIMQRLQYAGQREQRGLIAELRSIESENKFTETARHNLSMENARNAEVDFRMKKDVDANEQFVGYAETISNITDPPDTPAFDRAMTNAMIKFPEGARSQAGLRLTGRLYGKQPPTVEQMNRALALAKERGDVVTGFKETASGKVLPTFKTQEGLTKQHKGLTNELSKNLGITPEQFASRDISKDRATDENKVGKEPEKATHIAFDIDGRTVAVAKDKFNALNTAFPAQQAEATEVQRDTADGKKAIFDVKTKKFLRYAE